MPNVFPLRKHVPIGVDAQGRPVLPSTDFIKQWEDIFRRVGEFTALTNIELEELSDTRYETLTYLSLAPEATMQRRASDASMWRCISISASATISAGDFVDVDASSAAVTVTLPNVAASKGRIVGVSKVDSSANLVTVAGAINGQSSIMITRQYTSLVMLSNGSEWRLI